MVATGPLALLLTKLSLEGTKLHGRAQVLLVFFATAATAVFRLRDIKEGISVTEFLPQVRKAPSGLRSCNSTSRL